MKNYGNFYCLNFFTRVVQNKNLNCIKKKCENKDFCDVVVSSKDITTLSSINTENLIKCHPLIMQILHL